VAAELFGVSFALGAFFAGIVIRESDHSHRADTDTRPLQDAFAALFFVSVGMLLDPSVLIRDPLHVLAVLAIIVIGKSLIAFAIVRAAGRSTGSALVVAAGLAQVGEFSFILASLGIELGLMPEEGRNFILAGALLAITANPFVFRAATRIAGASPPDP
jgi:CPA2 family monovalent cation:H+ antiporter-2